LDGQPLTYNFSYEPADISRIALFRNAQWVGDLSAKELRQPDGSTLSLSLGAYQLAKIMARSQGKDPNDWLSYIGEIDELAQNRLAEKKKVQRNANRKSTSSKLPPPTTVSNYTELLASFVETDLGEVGKQL